MKYVNKFHIICGNASANRGDQANLLSQIELLRSAFPDAEITVESFNPELDSTWCSETLVSRKSLFSGKRLLAIWKADVVIWGGGALIADNCCKTLLLYWALALLPARVLFQKPVFAWAHGVVLTTRLGSFLARSLLSLVDEITVRDNNSRLKLEGLTRKTIQVTADPAILFKPECSDRGAEILVQNGVPINQQPIFAITPTFWPFYHGPELWFPHSLRSKWGANLRLPTELKSFKIHLAEIADRYVEEFNAFVVFLPRYAHKPWPDVDFLADIQTMMRHPTYSAVVNSSSLGPREHFSMWHHFDFLLSNALHDIIVASSLDTPCLQLFYEDKGREFFEEIKAAERMRPWDHLFSPAGVNEVFELTKEIQGNWLSNTSFRASQIALIQDRARANVRILANFIEQLTPE